MKSRNESSEDGRLTTLGVFAGLGFVSTLAAGAILYAGHHSETSKDDARIARNENVITHTTRIHDAVYYLNRGVNVRQSMKVDNGNANPYKVTPTNIRYTVGEGELTGKIVVVTRPLLETDSNGKQWLAFDDPETKGKQTQSKKLHDRADHLGYVALTDIEATSPGSIVINPYKEGAPVPTIIAVDYLDAGNDVGGFENSGTDQQIQFAMTSMAPEDTGK